MRASLLKGAREMTNASKEIFLQVEGSMCLEYQYTGFWNSAGICGVQHGRNEKTGQYYVILTELPDNRGTSVTNLVEQLATEVVNMLGYPVNSTVILEHYPERGGREQFPETWAVVRPDWIRGKATNPKDRHMWKHISRAEVLKLVGAPAEEEKEKQYWTTTFSERHKEETS